jgi:hypothetical protein
MYTFQLSISHHQVVCQKTERYKFTAVIVLFKFLNTVDKFSTFYLHIQSPVISNKDLWKATGQEDINLEIRKRKFRWISHTLRKEDGEIPKATLLWNPLVSRKKGRPKNS